MKKMVLGLALCLGLSQVVVAGKMEVKGLPENVKGALAWIKANPKKAAAIATGVTAVLAGGAYAGYVVYKNPAVKSACKATKDKTVAAGQYVGGKVVAGKDAVEASVKAHPYAYASGAVVAVIAAAVIAELATDKEAQLKLTNLWNKLFKKAATEEVVA